MSRAETGNTRSKISGDVPRTISSFSSITMITKPEGSFSDLDMR